MGQSMSLDEMADPVGHVGHSRPYVTLKAVMRELARVSGGELRRESQSRFGGSRCSADDLHHDRLVVGDAGVVVISTHLDGAGKGSTGPAAVDSVQLLQRLLMSP